MHRPAHGRRPGRQEWLAESALAQQVWEFRVAQHQSFKPHAAGRYGFGKFGAFEDSGQFGEQYAAGVYFNGSRLGGINQACGCSIPQQAGGDDVGIQHQSHGNVLAGGLSAPLGAVGGNFGFDFFHGQRRNIRRCDAFACFGKSRKTPVAHRLTQ